ncbi:hypothetical protein KIPB_006734, partial [Kipferlia bialata]
DGLIKAVTFSAKKAQDARRAELSGAARQARADSAQTDRLIQHKERETASTEEEREREAERERFLASLDDGADGETESESESEGEEGMESDDEGVGGMDVVGGGVAGEDSDIEGDYMGAEVGPYTGVEMASDEETEDAELRALEERLGGSDALAAMDAEDGWGDLFGAESDEEFQRDTDGILADKPKAKGKAAKARVSAGDLAMEESDDEYSYETDTESEGEAKSKAKTKAVVMAKPLTKEERKTILSATRRVLNRVTETNIKDCAEDLLPTIQDALSAGGQGRGEMVGAVIGQQICDSCTVGGVQVSQMIPPLTLLLVHTLLGTGNSVIRGVVASLIRRYLQCLHDMQTKQGEGMEGELRAAANGAQNLVTILSYCVFFRLLPPHFLADALTMAATTPLAVENMQVLHSALRLSGSTLRKGCPERLIPLFTQIESEKERRLAEAVDVPDVVEPPKEAEPQAPSTSAIKALPVFNIAPINKASEKHQHQQAEKESKAQREKRVLPARFRFLLSLLEDIRANRHETKLTKRAEIQTLQAYASTLHKAGRDSGTTEQRGERGEAPFHHVIPLVSDEMRQDKTYSPFLALLESAYEGVEEESEDEEEQRERQKEAAQKQREKALLRPVNSDMVKKATAFGCHNPVSIAVYCAVSGSVSALDCQHRLSLIPIDM